jgi:acetyl/propionyl-CoA carboxylase alpha subunit
MFRKVLIANRGEIACRVAATLREMGIRSVAVCSEADRRALHARAADEVRPIGGAEPAASYLDVATILGAARASGVEAVHPGYGFLAENADFAAAVEAAGLVFVGPTPGQIRTLGDKRAARALAEEAGVPVVPGAGAGDGDGDGDGDVERLAEAARRLGYPVLIKAALGGGGKGMRVAEDERALREGVESARRLARGSFGDGSVYLEKRLEGVRHVEVQVAGDGRGAVTHLFERECSLQRRHQKVMEEAPSPAVDEALRRRLTGAAAAVARASRYRGVGTVEFLLAPDGRFYFLEMNTRLQVEHPVTELVTGVDLVRLQLELAAGEPGLAQERVALSGHAVEARVYAEDAARGFVPQAGRALRVRWPRGPFVRVDAGIESGDDVPVHYDPLLAKVVAHGASRARALERLIPALDGSLVHGLVTNLPFLRALARAPEVGSGRFDVEWIERDFLHAFGVMAGAPAPELAVAAAALAEATDGVSGRARAGRASEENPFVTAGRWRLPGL